MAVKGGPFQTIDKTAADKTRALHKKHPRLGRRGLERALRESGIDVDPTELERFLQVNKIKPSIFRPLSWRGVTPHLAGSGLVHSSPEGDPGND